MSMETNETGNNHVHFNQDSVTGNDDPFVEDNSITITKSQPGHCLVHLGFLQVKHRYLIELSIPLKTIATIDEFDWKNSIIVCDDNDSSVPNINCTLAEYLGYKDDHIGFKIAYFAHKERLLKETLILVFAHGEATQKLKLVISARVLGRGKGTPMLRNGIHCTGIEIDDESDASDWAGFSRNEVDN